MPRVLCTIGSLEPQGIQPYSTASFFRRSHLEPFSAGSDAADQIKATSPFPGLPASYGLLVVRRDRANYSGSFGEPASRERHIKSCFGG